MGKRNRGTMALSVEGMKIVKTAVYQLGWTQDRWAERAYTSISTLKRLINGTPVEPSSLYSLIQALGLEVQDSYILKQPENLQPLSLSYIHEETENIQPLLQPLKTSSPQYQSGVFMTATFTEDKRPQIERAMRHLGELLINGQITFSENRGAVTVSGDFREENREHIKMTIAQIEKLFTSCKITW
jgi:transcriptional regulator with XRE-family HTH domain